MTPPCSEPYPIYKNEVAHWRNECILYLCPLATWSTSVLLSQTPQDPSDHGYIVPDFCVTPHQLEGRQVFQAGIIPAGNTRVIMIVWTWWHSKGGMESVLLVWVTEKRQWHKGDLAHVEESLKRYSKASYQNLIKTPLIRNEKAWAVAIATPYLIKPCGPELDKDARRGTAGWISTIS
jgi:hypothetical protein